MPLSQSGKYFANPRHAAQHDEQQAGADANQDPMAQPGDQAVTVTITKNPDGTYQTSGVDGQQTSHPDIASAMATAQQTLDPDMMEDADGGDSADENDAMPSVGGVGGTGGTGGMY